MLPVLRFLENPRKSGAKLRIEANKFREPMVNPDANILAMDTKN